MVANGLAARGSQPHFATLTQPRIPSYRNPALRCGQGCGVSSIVLWPQYRKRRTVSGVKRQSPLIRLAASFRSTPTTRRFRSPAPAEKKQKKPCLAAHVPLRLQLSAPAVATRYVGIICPPQSVPDRRPSRSPAGDAIALRRHPQQNYQKLDDRRAVELPAPFDFRQARWIARANAPLSCSPRFSPPF